MKMQGSEDALPRIMESQMKNIASSLEVMQQILGRNQPDGQRRGNLPIMRAISEVQQQLLHNNEMMSYLLASEDSSGRQAEGSKRKYSEFLA